MATEPQCRGFLRLARAGLLALMAGWAGFGAGCGQKSAPAANATHLDHAFTVPAVPQPPPTAEPSPTAPQAPPQDDVAAVAHAAANAMRSGDYESAAVALGDLKQQRGLSGDQLRAVNKSYADLYADLCIRAARGDAAAKATLEKLKQAQDRR